MNPETLTSPDLQSEIHVPAPRTYKDIQKENKLRAKMGRILPVTHKFSYSKKSYRRWVKDLENIQSGKLRVSEVTLELILSAGKKYNWIKQ
jgi:hypothetical protein